MKYLKFCSFAVLSLLLLAPSAQAAVTCTLGTNLQEIRMESGMEDLENLTVTCKWAADDIGTITPPENGDSTATPPVADTAATGAKFNLELDLNGMLSEDADAPTLMLMDLSSTDAATNAALDDDAAGKITGVVNDKGYRTPMPAGEVSARSVLWADVVFPATWDETAEETGGATFMISGVTVDAYSVNDDRLEATMVLTGTDIDTEDDADVARVKQALDLEFGEDNKAQKFNACEPGSKTISINVMEGFRKAWKESHDANDIMLMVSSGKISAKDAGILDVTAEGGNDEIVIDVSKAKNSKDDSTELAIKFEPAMGGSGDITLSAMLLPHRSEPDDMFMMSAELVVGSFDVCKGEMLFFPYVTSMSGWYTGIAVINDSKVDGSCSLNWGNMDLDDDEMEALSMIDVDGKDYTVVDVSKMNADYSGSLGVQCTFSMAHGFVFLSNEQQSIGQSYLIEGMTP